MQNLELERRLHEYRDLIGRDAEYVIKGHSESEARHRGPITRIIYESPPGKPGGWILEVGWMAIRTDDGSFPSIRGEPGKWELHSRQDPEEGFILTGGCFRTSELIEQADGTLVKEEESYTPSKYSAIPLIFHSTTTLIIHKPGDNLSLEEVTS